jgi:steroid 5-alpha reductase family enzyme
MRFFIGTAIAVLALMLVAFVAGLARGRHDGVDVVWGLGFVTVAIAGLILSGGQGRLVTALTVVWGLRLAIHIGRRQAGSAEDRRYVDLLRGGGPLRALVKVYLAQGAILWFVSLPVQVAQRYGEPSPWALVGVVIWAAGFTFEAVGDWQLVRFRADPAAKGKVLDTGLWRYTRHPNYFGDACVWWGLFAIAATGWHGWLTVLSPAVMTYLLARGTGKPLMEKHMSQRPGYAEYVSRTSGFIPLPPRRTA